MSTKKGAHLGGVRCVETLRGRCVMGKETDCWHLRKADGKPLALGGQWHRLWVFGHGYMTATRAAWLVAHGSLPTQKSVLVYRACESYDCVNPSHLKCGKRKAFSAFRCATGAMDTPARRVAFEKFRAHSVAVTKATPELRLWLVESSQSASDAAHGIGISKGRVVEIRRAEQRRPRSVFELRA